jgi:hypothetical protein
LDAEKLERAVGELALVVKTLQRIRSGGSGHVASIGRILLLHPTTCRVFQRCRRSRGVIKMRLHPIALATSIVISSIAPSAAADCPPEVTAAVHKAHAGAAIASCKQEKENGKTQFEVELAATTGKGMSLDVSPDGTILLTEQYVSVSDLPPAVLKAFAARYGAAKPTRAEMQTTADGKVSYELAFTAGTKKKEATFGSDGSFAEEE